MQEAVPVGKGKMIALIGMNIKEINNFLEEIKKEGICEIANDNAIGQTIVSGDVNGINSLQDTLKKNKKKFVPLNVSAPFHCSLMRPAAEVMESKINSINFNIPVVNIISNVTSKIEADPENIKKLLIEQIYSSVKWRESIININKDSVSKFIEIGPGKVLSGMVKRTLKNINCFSINSIDDIKKITI